MKHNLLHMTFKITLTQISDFKLDASSVPGYDPKLQPMAELLLGKPESPGDNAGAILAPRSILSQGCRTCLGLIYELNRTVITDHC